MDLEVWCFASLRFESPGANNSCVGPFHTELLAPARERWDLSPGLVGLWAGYLVSKQKKNLVNDFFFFFFGKVSCSRACGLVGDDFDKALTVMMTGFVLK